MHLAVFKFGGSAPYNYYCTMNLIIICLTVRAKDVNEQRCRFSALIAAFVVTTFRRTFGAPTARDELACARENSNTKDPYAVAVTPLFQALRSA